ncbi:ATP-binding protein [Nocardiopsis sp. EMB25]|uniref:ATP-binding protein n=1 Tax=Nocardiopsis sp. EMB25 TaxID=2835867 RepID=UPI002283B119|nr:ATP-binding protein [Nocardiopsis sp. EMB25]MCY9783728.1 ATP-binding protein [Nocardiopsis sp. EMB25]
MFSTTKATAGPGTAVDEPVVRVPDETSDLAPGIGAGRGVLTAVRESHRLPGVLASASSARRLVEHFLRRLDRTDLADTATLIVSELVTNAVEHGHPPVHLDLTWAQGGADPALRLDVHDHGRIAPRSADGRVDDEAESGRGLLIVDHLAARWGLAPHPVHGTHAWVEIATVAP